MVTANSHSSSELLTSLLAGPIVKGAVFGRHELRFDDYVVVLTPSGAPRMPNGIECAVTARAAARVFVGGGSLVLGGIEVVPGPAWDPVPVFQPLSCRQPGPEPPTIPLARSVGPSAEASGALLAGYVAGLVLLHRQRTRAQKVVSHVAPDLGPGAATLLRHAARGEVPEPVHELLATCDTSTLTATHLGIAWLRGLVSAGLEVDLVSAAVIRGRRTA